MAIGRKLGIPGDHVDNSAVRRELVATIWGSASFATAGVAGRVGR
jgi:hypothetical protein